MYGEIVKVTILTATSHSANIADANEKTNGRFENAKKSPFIRFKAGTLGNVVVRIDADCKLVFEMIRDGAATSRRRRTPGRSCLPRRR